MSKEKQIEEMAKDICHAPTCEVKKNGGTCYKYCKAYIYAFRAINAGYRKQIEGEWVYNTDDFTPKHRCTVCGYNNPIVAGEGVIQEPKHFCPNCGAKMKGGEVE